MKKAIVIWLILSTVIAIISHSYHQPWIVSVMTGLGIAGNVFWYFLLKQEDVQSGKPHTMYPTLIRYQSVLGVSRSVNGWRVDKEIKNAGKIANDIYELELFLNNPPKLFLLLSVHWASEGYWVEYNNPKDFVGIVIKQHPLQ